MIAPNLGTTYNGTFNASKSGVSTLIVIVFVTGTGYRWKRFAAALTPSSNLDLGFHPR